MGASPSGWLPPPYTPAPVGFSGYCAIRKGAPAVNFNNQFGISYVESAVLGVSSDEVWTVLKMASTLAAGTVIRGLATKSIRTFVTAEPNAGLGATGFLRLITIDANFDPATATWNSITALAMSPVTALNFSLVALAATGAQAVWPWTSIFYTTGAGLALPATAYGFAVKIDISDPAGNLPSVYDGAMAGPGLPGPDATVGQWTIHRD